MIGIIHRDIKPENILIRTNGHIYLSDFDLAKPISYIKDKFPSIESDYVIDYNSCVGTKEYIAPEVYNGSYQDISVDWWTFGVLMYELLIGGVPFRIELPPETDFKFSPDINISDNAKDLIESLLVIEPSDRLGHLYGAIEIKTHPFFDKVDWNNLFDMTPPIIPSYEKTSNNTFDNCYESNIYPKYSRYNWDRLKNYP